MRSWLLIGLLATASLGARAEETAGQESKAYLEAATTFLKAWGKSSWADAKGVAADKVAVTLGAAHGEVDVAGGKSDVKLLPPFHKLSVLREGGKVTGVKVGELSLRAGSVEKKGEATLHMSGDAGAVKVTSVELP